MVGSDTASPVARGLLVVGLLALTGAIVTAHRAPASGYEVSLYAATPSSVWLLLGCSMAVSVVVALWTPNVWTRRLGLGLGGGTTLTIVALPIFRGYWFVSGGDALTHLGWARGMQAGGFHPAELHYPGIHLVSIMFGDAAGIELQQAMMLVIVGLFGLFVVFVSLSTGVVIDRPHATTMGAFGAFLLLPITNLSMFVTPHSMSQGVLFSALVIFLMLWYMRGDGNAIGSPVGILLGITLVAIVVYHPQLAAHLLAVLVGICAVQLYARWRVPGHPITRHRTLYGHAVVLAAAFLVWTANHDFIQNVIRFHLTSTIEFFTGDASAGESVESQGDSLTDIGGSFLEVFLKMLGPAAAFCALVTVLLAWLYFGDDGRLDRATDGLLHYFAVTLAGLAALFGIYFFGSSGQMYFRVLGFALVFVTLGGAVAVAYVVGGTPWAHRGVPVRSLLVVGFCLLFVVSMVAFFPSPYIYDSSPHVSEQSVAGYEAALASVPDDQPIDGIRHGPNRYADATDPSLDRTRIHGSITATEIENELENGSEQHRYLSVGKQDYDREVIAYKELRYSAQLLDSIDDLTSLNKVQSNGEIDLYVSPGQDE